MKHIAFCSGGKDSVWMINQLIERDYELAEIVFVAIEKEFPQEKEFRDKMVERFEGLGKECTVLQTEDTWDNWFYGKVTSGDNEGKKRGYPLVAFSCWWTREAKVKVIEKYLKTIDEDYTQYIGYTIDEKSPKRQNIIKRYLDGKGDPTHKYPLVDWNLQEIDCMELCREHNILNPLYKHFKRLGCYLCPKQGPEALKTLQREFPEQWEELMFYVRETSKGGFVKSGEFNIKHNLKSLEQIENQVSWYEILDK